MRALCLYNFLDIGAALGVALVIIVAVLLVSAATFHTAGGCGCGIKHMAAQASRGWWCLYLDACVWPCRVGPGWAYLWEHVLTAFRCIGVLLMSTATFTQQVYWQSLNESRAVVERNLVLPEVLTCPPWPTQQVCVQLWHGETV